MCATRPELFTAGVSTVSTVQAAGPTDLSARALAPDLARGAMLLLIALANSHYFLSGRPVLGGYPRGGSALDSALTWLLATFVDGRAFPIFALLFGYGVAQVVRRHEAAGRRAVRRMLWRRAAVLIGVGLLDGLLLFVGDVLAAYGVLLLLGAWTVWWHDRWLLLLAALFLVVVGLPAEGSLSVSDAPPDSSMLPTDLADMLTSRPPVQAWVTLFGPIGFAGPFLVGLWAGRRRVLELPGQHRRLLETTAVVGVPLAVLGAQPVSLVLVGVLPVPGHATLEVIGPLRDAAGVLGGFGYAALIALVAGRLGGRGGRLVDAVAAVGQRSMTCYLAQSVVWAVAFTPFLLDLSATLTVTTTALLAVATWALTVLLADRMARAGRRGPFEALLRRATYGRRA